LPDNHYATGLPQLTPNRQNPSAEVLMQIVQYIMDNLHIDLSVSNVASRFSLEQGELLPAFQSHTGIALDQFVLRRRIERALHLLKHSNATDSEIALGVGWGTFTAFRNCLGVSQRNIGEILPRKSRLSVRGARAPTEVLLR
jgi:transcriptional regulator GlxA family with amidase domain